MASDSTSNIMQKWICQLNCIKTTTVHITIRE
jgi:hypothetical protein